VRLERGETLVDPDQSFDRRAIYRIDLCRDLGCRSRLIGFDFKSFTVDVPVRSSFRYQVRRQA
jgi:hypothetical protein